MKLLRVNFVIKKLLIYLTIVGISQHQIEDNVSYVRRKTNK